MVGIITGWPGRRAGCLGPVAAGLVLGGSVRASAFSLSMRSACRYASEVSTRSCPSHKAITVVSTPACRSRIAAGVTQRVQRDPLLFKLGQACSAAWRRVLRGSRSTASRLSRRPWTGGEQRVSGIIVLLSQPDARSALIVRCERGDPFLASLPFAVAGAGRGRVRRRLASQAGQLRDPRARSGSRAGAARGRGDRSSVCDPGRRAARRPPAGRGTSPSARSVRLGGIASTRDVSCGVLGVPQRGVPVHRMDRR